MRQSLLPGGKFSLTGGLVDLGKKLVVGGVTRILLHGLPEVAQRLGVVTPGEFGFT